MEMLLDLAMTFWQWTVLGVLVVAGWLVNKFDKEEEVLINFKYPEMPKMQPVKPNKCKNFQIPIDLCVSVFVRLSHRMHIRLHMRLAISV